VSGLIDFDIDIEQRFERGLWTYLGRVATALGVGCESCSIDLDVPVSAYIALDWRLNRYPDRDLALLWDEVHGWSVAVEASCGEDMLVLTYLGGPEVLPDPRTVVRLVAELRAEYYPIGRSDPPVLRSPGRHQELIDWLPNG